MKYTIPKPPSVNDYYANNKSGRGKGRYVTTRGKTWKRAALNELVAQGAALVNCPVRVRLDLGEDAFSPNADCDNFVKPVLDLLKAAGVILDDRRKFVRGQASEWVPGDQCTITLEAA
jgi:Holliday junction resolvase RusA-like endonuclease